MTLGVVSIVIGVIALVVGFPHSIIVASVFIGGGCRPIWNVGSL